MKPNGISRCALLLFALITISVSGCRESDPVRDRIDEIVEAIEDRDAEAVGNSLASDFDGNGSVNRQQALDELKRYFFGYKEISVYLSDVEILGSKSTATASFIAEVSGQPRKIGGLDQILPSSSTFEFRLRLRKEGDTWLLSAADWERVKSTPFDMKP